MLEKEYDFLGRKINNRVVFQPMEGCDCNEDGSPSELTREKYLRAAKSGAGIIWFEANAVCPEGRTNKGQMMLTKDNLSEFKALVNEVKGLAKQSAGVTPFTVLQLTHSGRQSIDPMVAYRNPVYEEKRPLKKGDGAIVTDEYLDSLAPLYAQSALLAIEAGFDAVDVKSCHGYLFQELLSAFNREGRYGGKYENRTRLLLDCIRAVKSAVPQSFPVVSRLGVSDMVPYPNGFATTESGEIDLTESKKLIRDMIDAGVSMINVTIGNPYYNPHINRPFRQAHYEAPEAPEVGLKRFFDTELELKTCFPEIAWVGSGVSYYRAELMEKAEELLSAGACDFVGFGRVSLAYPEFYTDYKAGKFEPKKTCLACSKCTALMRGGCVSGCAVYNEYYRNLYKEKILCKK